MSGPAEAGTTPGVLQVVRAASAAGQQIVGVTLEKIFALSQFLGKQHVRKLGVELAVLEDGEMQQLCELSERMPYAVPVEPAAMPIDLGLRDKYSGKAILLQNLVQPNSCFPDRSFICEQFKNSSLFINGASVVSSIYTLHVGNFYEGFDDCEMFNHNDLSAKSFNIIFEYLRAHTNQSTQLYANFETAEHPASALFSDPTTRLFFQLLPGLLCLFLSQLAIRACVARGERYWREQWHSGLSLVILAVTMMILGVFFFLDGYGTIGTFGFLMMNLTRPGFSFSRIGINFALTITWLDLSGQLKNASTRKSRPNRLAFQIGFVLFLFAEIPFSYLLLQPATSGIFIRWISVIFVVVESVVGSFFILSSLVVLCQIRGSGDLWKNKVIRRVSLLVLLSGCNSILNIGMFLVLSIKLDTVLNSPLLYLVCFGIPMYCRIFDAALQVCILKPPAQNLIPDSSEVGGAMRAIAQAVKSMGSVSSQQDTLNGVNGKVAPAPPPPRPNGL